MPREYAEETKKSITLSTSHTKEGLKIESMQDDVNAKLVSFPYHSRVIAIQR